MVFQGSRLVFLVPECFLWFFKVPGCFFMVSDGLFWLFKVPGWFFTVPGGFSRFKVVFLLFKIGFYGPRSRFHDFRFISGFLSSLMVPGWFKSKLSAAGTK